ncbi:MAG: P-loop NTPase [Flavobacteriales bacterium]
MKITVENVLIALSNVLEPEIKKDIVTLGLVTDTVVNGSKISFTLYVNNPALHSKNRMKDACLFALERNFGKDLDVELNIVPNPKNPENVDSRKILPGVKHVIAVASGKGGVGKSTVSANIAAGLAQKGYKVGLLDADIYGPSAPLMMDLLNDKPQPVQVGEKQYIEPLTSYGVKVLSIGFFAEVNQAIVWRGPMASKALNQMFTDAYWGELDFMILDLPPGTGDIHLSLVQTAPLSGAVIVTTPQDVSLADARKGINMFKMESINVPIIGLVENMSWFTPAELPDNKYFIFGKEGGKQLAQELDVPLLAQLPLIQSIRESGDAGRPAILQENTPARMELDKLISNLEKAVSSL